MVIVVIVVIVELSARGEFGLDLVDKEICKLCGGEGGPELGLDEALDGGRDWRGEDGDDREKVAVVNGRKNCVDEFRAASVVGKDGDVDREDDAEDKGETAVDETASPGEAEEAEEVEIDKEGEHEDDESDPNPNLRGASVFEDLRLMVPSVDCRNDGIEGTVALRGIASSDPFSERVLDSPLVTSSVEPLDLPEVLRVHPLSFHPLSDPFRSDFEKSFFERTTDLIFLCGSADDGDEGRGEGEDGSDEKDNNDGCSRCCCTGEL